LYAKQKQKTRQQSIFQKESGIREQFNRLLWFAKECLAL